jgi:NAD(P)-dependent dehydrogenase (short-subunit alcohol dehydrogenase family)
MTAPFDLTGKVAIVTGSTKGLGRAMAQGLAAAGANVVVSSRKQDLCHVGDWDAVPGFVDRVMERFGHIDVLVNNAGINPSWTGMVDMPLDLWRKVFSVNLEGPLRMSQLVVPHMRDNGGGSIINISTMGAYSGGQGVGAYGPSKAGLLSLTRICASEWAQWKVRVNAVSPGPIRSEMTDGAERTAPGFYERSGNATMLKRVGDTHEIAGPIVYLASDASSYVTGEDHLVSGGMLR